MPDTREHLPPRNTNGTYYVRPSLAVPKDPPWYDAPLGALFLCFACFLGCWGILALGLLVYRTFSRILGG